MRFKKRWIKKFVERLTNTHIYRDLPRGVDFVHDIQKALPKYTIHTIFDVGANIGQSAKLFLRRIPGSQIYCFEPVANTYRLLKHQFQNEERIKCFQLAFGSLKGTGEMVLQGSSDMFYLLEQSKEKSFDNLQKESVMIDTLDDFCFTHNIESINYLKIDTEGGDLDVLKGAMRMLTEQKVDIVQVEAGMNPSNDRHVSFEALKAFLELHGYYLFGVYEQVNEWPTRSPNLRRTNPVFISQQLIEKNRGPMKTDTKL